ncbi:MAG: hypothetical protein CL840_14715 [Crocinitomicaceae bacterium]|nr:hypothetical protein [Crocinitomicaceae bacterium]
MTFGIQAQEGGIKLVVDVKHKGKPYNLASIRINKDASFFDKSTTTETGQFSYLFEYGAIYHIYFEGEGMATKCLELDLKQAPEHEKDITHDWEIGELSLFKTYEGIDLTILEKPIGRIHYDEEMADFTIDYKYGLSREKEIKQLERKVEVKEKDEQTELNQLEKSYNETLSKGDTEFRQENYKKALLFYEQAKQLMPEGTKAQDKIAETNKVLEKEANFKDMVLAGDEYFRKGEWILAKDKYQQAKLLKPSASYPKSQLAAIAQKVKEQELKNNEFNNHMVVANAAYASGNYTAAAASYKKALAINPNAALAKNQLDKSNTEISKLNEAEIRRQQSQNALLESKRAIQDEDLVSANQILNEALILDPTNESLQVEKKKVDSMLAAEKKKKEEAERAKQETALLAANKAKAEKEEFEKFKKKGMEADQAGNKESAIYFFKKAVAINPNDQAVNSRLRTLQKGDPAAAANASPKTVSTENEFQELDKLDKKSDNFVALLATKYPQGMTEKTYKEKNKTVTKRIVVKGNLGTEYMKVEHAWGGVYYFKNGEATTKYVWQKEAK